jgi:hypothetical protein
MSALTHLLFRAPVPLSRGGIIEWWESRRPVYNAAVGVTGLFTLGVMNVCFALPPNAEPVPWIVSVLGTLLYGTSANMCYTLGWIAELQLRRWFPRDHGVIGAALFRYGLAVSVCLTLVPAGLAVLQWFARVGLRVAGS